MGGQARVWRGWGTGTAVIFGVRATDTRHPSGACATGVSRVRGQAVSALCRRAGAARARAGGGAVAGTNASQGVRSERRCPRKAEAASGGRRKRYRGAAGERTWGVSDTRQRVRGSGGLAWAELGRASACGLGRAGRRERERWCWAGLVRWVC